MRRVFDFSAAIPAARVSCNFNAIGNHAHGLLVSADKNALADERDWDRVGVGVQTDTGLFGNDGWHEQIDGRRMRRQRTQAGALD